MLHNCKAASAIWTEEAGRITGKYEFTTVSEETAKNFKAIVEGFMAIGELRYSDIPAVKKVMNGLKVETRERYSRPPSPRQPPMSRRQSRR